tara:strand:+ start:329 stop:892 length:564 start_codon:yes stop_codon:yes gene_type:complete
MKSLILFLFCFFSFCSLLAKDKWEIDNQISSITFEVPVFLATNVKGKFNEFKGFIVMNNELDNNKAIFSVNIESIDMNYIKYKDLLLSEVFLYKEKYPIALVETQKFLYKNQKKLILDVELRIKNISKVIPVELEIIKLSDDLIQIKGDMSFSRIDFNLGINKWASTAILKEKIKIKTNLFLFRNQF